MEGEGVAGVACTSKSPSPNPARSATPRLPGPPQGVAKGQAVGNGLCVGNFGASLNPPSTIRALITTGSWGPLYYNYNSIMYC